MGRDHQLHQLRLNPLRADPAQSRGKLLHRGQRLLLYGKSQLRREADGPQDAQRVLTEALPGLPHAAHNASFQILQPAEEIHQPFRVIVGHGVDGQIPAPQILPQVRGECHLCGMPAVLIFSVNPVSGHLKAFPLQHHRDRAVLQPGVDRPLEQGLHLLRSGGGGDVPVLGRPAQDRIPHAAAHRIGLETGILKRLDDILPFLGHGYPNLLSHVALPVCHDSLLGFPGRLPCGVPEFALACSPAYPGAFLKNPSCLFIERLHRPNRLARGRTGRWPPRCRLRHWWP